MQYPIYAHYCFGHGDMSLLFKFIILWWCEFCKVTILLLLQFLEWQLSSSYWIVQNLSVLICLCQKKEQQSSYSSFLGRIDEEKMNGREDG